jgi:F0F1-type ATP synthase assembly protein I
MSDSNTQMPSTKRLGYMIGVFIASIVSLVMLGVIVGLSIGISAVQFEFVYSTLNTSILWIIGMLVGASAGAYTLTKRKENQSQDNQENQDDK